MILSVLLSTSVLISMTRVVWSSAARTCRATTGMTDFGSDQQAYREPSTIFRTVVPACYLQQQRIYTTTSISTTTVRRV
jgi:hypothetical protein